jgi:adenylate cyclase
LSADDVRPYAEEALLFAREAGDQKHAALILASFGRVFATSGTFDEFVEVASQGSALARETGDAEVFAACNGILSQGYYFAGLLREALRENDAATAAARTQDKSTEGVVLGLTASKMFGYDVAHWRHCIRARILVLLGQFAEAEETLAQALQVDPGGITFVVQHNAHAAAIDLAWHRRDFSAARRHAEEVANYADQSGSSYLRVKALSYSGQAESVGNEPDRAAQLFREALTLARQSRMGLEGECRLMAHLSDCYYRAGDFEAAIATATEAIQIARQRTDRVAELHGNIVAGAALLAGGQAALHPRVSGHLRRSEYLCNLSGAEIFRQSIERLEAGLKGAESLRSLN